MPSKTSFFNKGIFRSNLKRFWLITFSYSLFLLFFVMGYVSSEISRMSYTHNAEELKWIGTDIFGQSSDFMTFFMGFFCLISALAVFSYMHFQKNTAMIHSLPLRRETLFTTNYLSGLLLVAFPLILNTIILVIAETAYGIPGSDYALLWLGVNLVITFLLYTFAVFAGMFTGHMAAQAIFYLIYNFLAVFLEGIADTVLHNFLFGYVKTGYKLLPWSPLYYMMQLLSGFSRDNPNVTAVIGYLIAGILFLAASFLLYRRRHMEVASDVISFSWVKPVFKYVVAFCSSALLGTILVSVLDISKQLIPFTLAYLFGGFVGYFASEMLLRKTFRVFKAYKGFLVYSIILVMLLCSVNFDIYGYECYIPKDSDIEIMYFGQVPDPIGMLALKPEDYDPDKHRYLISSPEDGNWPERLDAARIKELRKTRGIIESREAITKARLIHDHIVRNVDLYRFSNSGGAMISSVNPNDSQYRTLYFAYRLKNGSIVERQYNLRAESFKELDTLIRDYMSVPDVMERYEPVLGKEAADIRRISIFLNTKEKPGTVDITDIQGFLDAYKKDVLAEDPVNWMFGFADKSMIYNVDITIEFKEPAIMGSVPQFSQPLRVNSENMARYLIDNGLITKEQLVELQLDFTQKYND